MRVRARSWPRVVTAAREHARPAVEGAGGSYFGLVLPQIGLAADEGIAITAWPDRDALERGAGLAVKGIDEVEESSAERFVATVRPETAQLPPPGGVYAHRRFELAESD